MHLHLIYVVLGLADWWAELVLGPRPGQAPRGKHASGASLTGAALLLAAGVFITALVAPALVPSAARTLQPAGSNGLAHLSLVLCAALLLYALYAAARFLLNCHRIGRAIHEGSRKPSWRRD